MFFAVFFQKSEVEKTNANYRYLLTMDVVIQEIYLDRFLKIIKFLEFLVHMESEIILVYIFPFLIFYYLSRYTPSTIFNVGSTELYHNAQKNTEVATTQKNKISTHSASTSNENKPAALKQSYAVKF